MSIFLASGAWKSSHWSVLLDQTPLQLDREGIKEKEYGETEIMGNGKLFEGGGYFQYFHLRGAIIRGRQLIKEWLLFEGIWYDKEKLHNYKRLCECANLRRWKATIGNFPHPKTWER